MGADHGGLCAFTRFRTSSICVLVASPLLGRPVINLQLMTLVVTHLFLLFTYFLLPLATSSVDGFKQSAQSGWDQANLIPAKGCIS